MDSLINLGTAFHNFRCSIQKGPFTESCLGLNIWITKYGTVAKLLKLYLQTGLGVIKKLKYEGAKPLKILKSINRILNSILNFTGSQCKSTNKE